MSAHSAHCLVKSPEEAQDGRFIWHEVGVLAT